MTTTLQPTFAAEIQAIESTWTEGAWTHAVAALHFAFDCGRITAAEERTAMAIAHRLLADLLDATPRAERWSASAEVVTSYRNRVQVSVSIELARGDAGELQAASALLIAITQRAN